MPKAPVTGGRRGPDEQNLHRNKRSLAIDLKHSEGRAFHRLARDADVVVEIFAAREVSVADTNPEGHQSSDRPRAFRFRSGRPYWERPGWTRSFRV